MAPAFSGACALSSAALPSSDTDSDASAPLFSIVGEADASVDRDVRVEPVCAGDGDATVPREFAEIPGNGPVFLRIEPG
jgi:hypothetical protein